VEGHGLTPDPSVRPDTCGLRWHLPPAGRGGSSSWQGFDGGLLVAQVVDYPGHDPIFYCGFIRGDPLDGTPRFATAAEAMAAVDAAWATHARGRHWDPSAGGA
jgi:hypothetical protein